MSEDEEIETYDEFYKIRCPHCKISIIVSKTELNCKIFRCGQYKITGQPINPHLPKAACDKLAESDQINGCARPFRFDGYRLEICDYL